MKPKRGERVEAVCKRCGCLFTYVFYARQRHICGTCLEKPRRQSRVSHATHMARLEREQAERQGRKKGRLTLDEKIREATRLHLTYGQYMALLERRPH